MHIKLLIIRYISKVKLKGESKGGKGHWLKIYSSHVNIDVEQEKTAQREAGGPQIYRGLFTLSS